MNQNGEDFLPEPFKDLVNSDVANGPICIDFLQETK